MAYDEDLADRIRSAIQGSAGLTEKRMFGGLAFLVNGHMAVSASSKGGLLLRVDPQDTASLVGEDGVTRYQMRGRAMDGWLHVDSSATEGDQALSRWVQVGVSYAESLPPRSS